MNYPYPFSAIVGQDAMKLALILNGINPGIGGVLISGPKGSGKTRAARGLAALLPRIRVNVSCPFGCDPNEPCGQCEGGAEHLERPTPFVSLPIGATEDRVLGTIDLEQAVRHGRKHFEPGLLARVNRGVLYVDEVNLLPDHLVDILLDVAVSGVNVVEREGISMLHPARFILIGTMNPEEGELRPQLLDRFGLAVTIENILDPALRSEVVRRSVQFETQPEEFIAAYAAEEERLRERIGSARKLLPKVRTSQEIDREIAELCIKECVEGMRADIVIRKASMTLAAWEGRDHVIREDVARVAEFALRHRRRRPPEPPIPPPLKPPQRKDHSQSQQSEQKVFEPASLGTLPNPQSDLPPRRKVHSSGGRGGQLRAGEPRGPYVRAQNPRGKIRDLALDATLRAAAVHGMVVRAEDLREKVRRAPVRHLYLFVLDTSRSMGAHRRMEVTKGVLMGLLEDAYHKRDEVALVLVQGTHARLALAPTRSVRRVQDHVRLLPVGGRTPLADGLRVAKKLFRQARRRSASLACSVIVISDGRPTVGSSQEVDGALSELQKLHAQVVLVDTEEGHARLGFMREWARRWKFRYITLDDLRAKRIKQLVRAV